MGLNGAVKPWRLSHATPLDRDVAERVGFEPTVPFRVHALSRRVPSAARPSLPESWVLSFARHQGRWRRGGDSNPRYGFWPYNGLANRRLQPLGHLSARHVTYRKFGALRDTLSVAQRVMGVHQSA